MKRGRPEKDNEENDEGYTVNLSPDSGLREDLDCLSNISEIEQYEKGGDLETYIKREYKEEETEELDFSSPRRRRW